MADQASMKAGGDGTRTTGLPEGVVGGIAEFGNDMATLVELQAKLALIDLKESTAKASLPIALCVIGLALVLASLPVVLFGTGLLLAALLHIGEGWAILLTGAVVLVISGVVVVVAGMRVRNSFDILRRSREELARNLSWIRTVLVHSGRSSSGRRF
ncbi:MAG TPA: phage holin family protein [Isosphaeraceae bacterium]|nr:phage holin family protein [Isosphaeraceae bacterium]